ncbi:hypothetical protein ABPG74_021973 [Tetrahymena malaccensis]
MGNVCESKKTENVRNSLKQFNHSKPKKQVLYVQIVGQQGSGKKYLKSLIIQNDQNTQYEQQKSQSFDNGKIEFELFEKINLEKLELKKMDYQDQYVVFIYNNKNENSQTYLQDDLKKAQNNNYKYKKILICSNKQECTDYDLKLENVNSENNRQEVKNFFNNLLKQEEDQDEIDKTAY